MVFEDEASLSNSATLSCGWSRIGVQPLISQPQRKRERKTLFGCVCPSSGELFCRVSSVGNTSSFFSFLLSVVRFYSGRKVYVVLDNAKYHHANRLKPVLERYKDRIELIYLPPYSPDLNPVERIWWVMRKDITHNRFVQSMSERVDAFNLWCASIDKEKVKRICNTIGNI